MPLAITIYAPGPMNPLQTTGISNGVLYAAEWPCCHDPLRLSPLLRRFVLARASAPDSNPPRRRCALLPTWPIRLTAHAHPHITPHIASCFLTSRWDACWGRRDTRSLTQSPSRGDGSRSVRSSPIECRLIHRSTLHMHCIAAGRARSCSYAICARM